MSASQNRTLQQQYHERQEQERQRLIRLLHVAAAELGWKRDGAWGDIKRRHGGRESLAEMTVAELEAVLDFARLKGFQVRHRTETGGRSRPLSQQALARKLRALWLELHGLGIVRLADESALCAWASNSRSRTVTAALHLFTPAQLGEAVERLKNWRARELAKGWLHCPLCGAAFKPSLKQAQAFPRLTCDRHADGRQAAYQWSPARPEAKPTL